MVLATPVLSDAAVLSTSTAPASLPAGNLKTMSISEVWRSLDPMNAWIVADMLTAKPINLIALLGHSGSSRASVRVRAATTQAGLTSAPGYDSGLLPARSHQSGYDATWAAGVSDEQYGAGDTNIFRLWIPATRTFRFWRIDIADPLGSFFDAGRLYIAKAWQPVTNINYGAGQGLIDPSRVNRTAGGRLSPNERPKYRYQEFTLSFSNEQEMYDNAYEIERQFGRTRDLFFMFDPTATANLQRRSLYCTLTNLAPITVPAFNIFEKPFRIEEIIR